MTQLKAGEIRLLKALNRECPMIAAWSHRALSELWHLGLVEKATAYDVDGRLSRNSIWTITANGKAALEAAERAR